MKTLLSKIRENLLMTRKLQQNLKTIGSVNRSSRNLWIEPSSAEGESWEVGVSLRLAINWKFGWKSTIGWSWKS
jgi:hypothetical protein